MSPSFEKSGKPETNERSGKAESLAFLSSATLLTGENASEYDQLVRAVAEKVKPTDIFEEIWVGDIVYLVWQTLRYRKMKTVLIEASKQQALEKLLRPFVWEMDRPSLDAGLSVRRSEDLALRYILKEEEAVEEVDDLLKTAGLTWDAVMAEACAMRGEELQRMDNTVAASERRRNIAIDLIERRREYFAARLRQAAMEIEATEFRVIEDRSADTRKAA